VAARSSTEGRAATASPRITNGYADATFRPTNNIERQAIAAFLFRYDQIAPPAG